MTTQENDRNEKLKIIPSRKALAAGELTLIIVKERRRDMDKLLSHIRLPKYSTVDLIAVLLIYLYCNH